MEDDGWSDPEQMMRVLGDMPIRKRPDREEVPEPDALPPEPGDCLPESAYNVSAEKL